MPVPRPRRSPVFSRPLSGLPWPWLLAVLAPLLCTALIVGPWLPAVWPALGALLRSRPFLPYFPVLLWALLRFPLRPATLCLALVLCAGGLDLYYGDDTLGTLVFGDIIVAGAGAAILYNRLLLRRLRASQEALVASELARRTLTERQAWLVLASHNLRTPLTSVLGFASLLNDTLVPGAEGSQTANTTGEPLSPEMLDRARWAASVLVQEASELAQVVETVLQAAEGERLAEVPGLTRPTKK